MARFKKDEVAQKPLSQTIKLAQTCRREIGILDTVFKPFPLLPLLSSLIQAGDMGDWPVLSALALRRIAGRVCAIRKSQDAIDRAQRRLS